MIAPLSMRSLLAIALVACGEVQPQSPTDGSPDADDRPITVRVVGDDNQGVPGEPLAGIRVFIYAPDQSYQIATTGADGIATVNSPAGSTVLVARTGLANKLTFFVGVNPGDAITAGIRPSPTFTPSSLVVTFSAPTAGGAATYDLRGPCTGSITPTTGPSTLRVEFFDCTETANATVSIIPNDANATPLGYSAQTGLNLNALAGTTVTMPAYQALSTTSAQLTNIPASITTVSFNTNFVTETSLGTVYYGNAFATGPVTATTTTLTAPIVPIGQRTMRSARLASTTFMPADYYEFSDGQAPTFDLSVGTAIPRLIAEPRWDMAARTASWIEEPNSSGATPEILLSQGSYFIEASQQQIRFDVYAPYPAEPSYTLPPFPGELESFVPGPTDNGFVNRVQGLTMSGRSFHALLDTVDQITRQLPYSYGAGEPASLWLTGYHGK